MPIAPMPATLTDRRDFSDAWLLERKFDGEQTSFSRLQRRLGVMDPTPALVAAYPVVFCVFDLRQPRFLGLRDDKRPAEVEREQPR